MADLGLLITKPFVTQKESGSVDLDLQDTRDRAAGGTAPAQLIRGSAASEDRVCHRSRSGRSPPRSPHPLTFWGENLATATYLCRRGVIHRTVFPPGNSTVTARATGGNAHPDRPPQQSPPVRHAEPRSPRTRLPANRRNRGTPPPASFCHLFGFSVQGTCIVNL